MANSNEILFFGQSSLFKVARSIFVISSTLFHDLLETYIKTSLDHDSIGRADHPNCRVAWLPESFVSARNSISTDSGLWKRR